MPNWCSNWVSIRHDDPEKIKQMQAAVSEGNLFETFAPLKGGWDYTNAIEAWGTKWDAQGIDVQNVTQDGKAIDMFFDTAWGPPTGFYEKLTEQGFDVDATYHEPGMCFAGHYTSENGDDSYEYDFSNDLWRDDIHDSDVVDLLEGEYESYLEYQEDEEGEEE